MILDMWNDPRNPYKGRGNVTCGNCLNEFNNGRREGFLDINQTALESAQTSTGIPEVPTQT